MDLSDNDLLQSSFTSNDDVKKEPVALVHDLLEEGWFFGKLLETKPRMSRSYSDLCPNLGNAILADSSPPILSKKGVSGLVRAPSLPRYMGTQDKVQGKEDKNAKIRKLTRQLSDLTVLQKSAGPCSDEKKERSKRLLGQSSRPNLVRTPSLPPCIGREDENYDEDTEITMSRLIREAVTNSSDLLPSKRAVPPKGSVNNLSMPKYKPPSPPPPRIPDLEISSTLSQKESQHQSPKQRYLKKSFSSLDMGSKYEKQDSSPTAANIMSEGRVRRVHRSEAWQVQTCAPPIPIWAGKNSTEDMKAQLKFWARSVASNVR